MNAYLFDNLRKAFHSTGFSPELFYILLLILCVLILLSLGYGISLFLKKKEKYTGVISVSTPKKVRELLTEAMTKRCKFELLFDSHSSKKESIHCTLMDITKDELVLDLPFAINDTLNLTRKRVTCYFYLPAKKDFFVFYNFSSQTITTYQKEGQLLQLTIALPESITLGQKRNFLRVHSPTASTPLSEVAVIRLWPAQFKNDQLQTNAKLWGDSLLYSKKDAAWTEDISQGGLRLVIQNGKKYEQKLKKLSMLFVYFSIKKHGKNNSLRYMTNCKIRSFYLDIETGVLTLGLQFLHQAKKGESPELVIWEKIGPEQGIESIGNWAFLFHIQEHRSNSALN